VSLMVCNLSVLVGLTARIKEKYRPAGGSQAYSSGSGSSGSGGRLRWGSQFHVKNSFGTATGSTETKDSKRFQDTMDMGDYSVPQDTDHSDAYKKRGPEVYPMEPIRIAVPNRQADNSQYV
jgi:hypothetical protein